METDETYTLRPIAASSPHSLGKLIEWKLFTKASMAISKLAPHSLGKLIEWKRKCGHLCRVNY